VGLILGGISHGIVLKDGERVLKQNAYMFLQGVFRSALSRNEPPETFALQTVQEAIKPQVYNLILNHLESLIDDELLVIHVII
jgi:hypothetical protein